jgi:hypothetical protein
MGFKVSDLVAGLGVFLLVIGVMSVLIMSPATYWASVVAEEHERSRVKETAAEIAPKSPQAR